MISGVGILLSVAASVLFCLMSAYTKLLAPLDGMMILIWRLFWTFPGLLALVYFRKQMPQFQKLLLRFRCDPRMWLCMPILIALLAAQLWVFLWAPMNEQMLSVTMGYFLLPIVMVVIGRFFYHEKLSPLQHLAVLFAVIGIAHEWWQTQAFAWPTLLTALGYPPYFMLRKYLQLDAVTGFLLEVLLLFPLVVITLCLSETGFPLLIQMPSMWFLLPGLGILSTFALASYVAAHRLLPMNLFGILGYVEPVLLFFTAILFFQEPFSKTQLLTYGPIAIAVILTAWHSFHLLNSEKKQAL